MQIMLFVGMFSPIVRVLPRMCAHICGRSAWLAPAVALLPTLLFFGMCWKLFLFENDGKGLADLVAELTGKAAGRIIAGVFLLFQLYYAGYIIRNSAERIVSTVYPDSPAWVFSLVLSAVCALAAAGRTETLARTSEIFFLIITGTLAVISAFSLPGVKVQNLLPVSRLDALPVLKGAGLTLNLLSLGVYALFLGGDVETENAKIGTVLRWKSVLCAVSAVMIIITVGRFGAAMTWKTQQPFFVSVRDIKIFDLFDRIEALVMAVWVVTDFTLVSVELKISAEIFRKIFGAKERKIFAFSAAGIVFFISIIIAPNAFSLWNITQSIMPRLNIVFGLITIPLFLVVRYIIKNKKKKDEKRY